VTDETLDILEAGYNAFYAEWGSSPTLRSLWRQHVTGQDFPEQFEHISFVRLADLESLRSGLDLASEATLVDLACGAGGPGLWVARRSRARLIGVDLSAIAVQRAAERARDAGVDDVLGFRRGTFEQTGLDTASADGVMSVDAIQYGPDTAATFAEIARVLRPGGRLAFIAFELDAQRVAGLPVWRDPIADYRPHLERAGFRVLRYDQLAGWHDQVVAGYTAVLGAQEALETELGAAAEPLIAEATITLEIQPYSGHVLAVASRM
jgi:SAM-dependent methyltransferase